MKPRSPWLAALAVTLLLSSWVVAWFMPAPQVCVALDCGPLFDEHAVPRPLQFLNWEQLLVLILGVASFTSLLALSFKREHDTYSGS